MILIYLILNHTIFLNFSVDILQLVVYFFLELKSKLICFNFKYNNIISAVNISLVFKHFYLFVNLRI